MADQEVLEDIAVTQFQRKVFNLERNQDLHHLPNMFQGVKVLLRGPNMLNHFPFLVRTLQLWAVQTLELVYQQKVGVNESGNERKSRGADNHK